MLLYLWAICEIDQLVLTYGRRAAQASSAYCACKVNGRQPFFRAFSSQKCTHCNQTRAGLLWMEECLDRIRLDFLDSDNEDEESDEMGMPSFEVES